MYHKFMIWYCQRQRLLVSAILFLTVGCVAKLVLSGLSADNVWLYLLTIVAGGSFGISLNAMRRAGNCDVIAIIAACINDERRLTVNGIEYVIIRADGEEDDQDDGFEPVAPQLQGCSDG